MQTGTGPLFHPTNRATRKCRRPETHGSAFHLMTMFSVPHKSLNCRWCLWIRTAQSSQLAIVEHAIYLAGRCFGVTQKLRTLSAFGNAGEGSPRQIDEPSIETAKNHRSSFPEEVPGRNAALPKTHDLNTRLKHTLAPSNTEGERESVFTDPMSARESFNGHVLC